MKKHFVFYFPYHGFGGVPILFLRLAEQLSLLGHSTSVIDYNDGYMAKNKSEKTQLIKFLSSDQIIQIPEDSILVLQSDLPWGVPKNLSSTQPIKIFFWNCYPYNFIPIFPGRIGKWIQTHHFLLKLSLNTLLFQAKSRTGELVSYMHKNKALVFMDQANLKMTEWALDINLGTQKFLPIPVSAKQVYKPKDIESKTLHLVWLGRLADFKIHSLHRILEDLSHYLHESKDTKIHFTIIGQGQYDGIIQPLLQNAKGWSYEIIPSIAQDQLHLYLNTHCDVLFAMGTSALEGGLSGVPTVLMNFSYNKIKSNYNYNFLHETQNYNLGELVSFTKQTRSMRSFSDVIQIIKKQKKHQAELDQAYVLNYHSLEKITEQFIDVCSESKAFYQHLFLDLNLEKPWLYKLRKYLFKKRFF